MGWESDGVGEVGGVDGWGKCYYKALLGLQHPNAEGEEGIKFQILSCELSGQFRTKKAGGQYMLHDFQNVVPARNNLRLASELRPLLRI